MPEPPIHPSTLTATEIESRRARVSRIMNDPKTRSFCIQAAVFGCIALVLTVASLNAARNLERAGIASGFGFLSHAAGFDISQSLIEYSRSSVYGRVFFVGLLNTLVVSGVSIVFATLIGFLVGILRLSPNWLMNRMALVFIEVVRNIPLLLQLLFWYIAILNPLPGPNQAFRALGSIFLCNRGLIVPRPVFEPGSGVMLIALAVAVAGAVLIASWAKKRQRLTGKGFPVYSASVCLLIGLPLIALAAAGFPIKWDVPVLQGFNFRGGITLQPEFTALALALTLFTASFIAENVRSGIEAVPKAQIEAARALGIKPARVLRLVVIPQAMRVIIPPLTSQYLTLVKNSSLAVVIGYPDLVSVFAGTTMNQTGQAVEIIAMTMLVYLTFSLTISAVMNWYNNRMAIRE